MTRTQISLLPARYIESSGTRMASTRANSRRIAAMGMISRTKIVVTVPECIRRARRRGPRELVDQALADGDRDRLDTVERAQAFIDALDVVLDRVRGQAQLVRDLAGGLPLGHQRQHLPLARRKRHGWPGSPHGARMPRPDGRWNHPNALIS